MRYIVKFTNGYWRVFDTHFYSEVGDYFLLQKDANTVAEKLNSRKK